MILERIRFVQMNLLMTVKSLFTPLVSPAAKPWPQGSAEKKISLKTPDSGLFKTFIAVLVWYF